MSRYFTAASEQARFRIPRDWDDAEANPDVRELRNQHQCNSLRAARDSLIRCLYEERHKLLVERRAGCLSDAGRGRLKDIESNIDALEMHEAAEMGRWDPV